MPKPMIEFDWAFKEGETLEDYFARQESLVNPEHVGMAVENNNGDRVVVKEIIGDGRFRAHGIRGTLWRCGWQPTEETDMALAMRASNV